MLSHFYAIFSSLYDLFFFVHFLCFPIYNNVYPKHYQSCKKMSANDIREFIFENYYKRIGFSKEGSYYSMKRLKRKIFCCSLTK